MRDPLHTDEFEDYLQDKVNNHRMYPSDQIWRNIQKEIHGEGKWPALTYISIFIITALAISTLMVKPEERLHKNIAVYPVQASVNETKQTQEEASNTAPVQYAYADKITEKTLQSVSEIITEHITEQNAIALSANDELVPLVKNKSNAEINKIAAENALEKASVKIETAQAPVASAREEKIAQAAIQFTQAKPASRYFSTLGLLNLSELRKPVSNQTSLYNTDEIWRSYSLLSAKDLLKKKLSKFSFQFYVTPSISYRRLNDANGKTANSYTAIPRNTNYQLDVKQVVEHRAAVGAEVGFALGYKLTQAITVKGGLQFNMRQYNIKAYTISKADPSLSSALPENNDGALTTPEEDRMSDSYFTSADRSSLSNAPIILYNRYYEVAAPLGIEWRIASFGNNKLTVNVAAALQPTYTFDKEPFVITTDYKNYTDGASIMRNWNLNSNVEAFISYKLGSFKWQLGPQFRYQHFSTYSNAYPIREHLIDYGIKLGFTKPLD